MRGKAAILAVLGTSWALLAGGCGAAEPRLEPRSSGASSWRAVPAGPLSAREGALGLWTGREVVLVGGSDAPPCPPNAECVAPDVPPLADGAAFDPESETWRRIAPSPVPFEWAQGIVVGATGYVWIPGSPGRPKAESAFLAYRIEDDRWDTLPLPSGDLGWYHGIVQVGDRIVLYSSSDEESKQPDLLFDPRSATWSELPPDPLSPSFDRSMAWGGRELILFDHELVPNPGSEEPAVTRAAALDLKAGSWRRLPDSEILATGPWVLADGRLLNPVLGGADGGRNAWGRRYPFGGILDPASGRWSDLPEPPTGEDDFGSGVLTSSGGHYFGYRGWILDATSDTWIELPALGDDEHVTGRTVVNAGADLLVFGGANWAYGASEGVLLDDAWSWSP
jgi:hypothetical protein